MTLNDVQTFQVGGRDLEQGLAARPAADDVQEDVEMAESGRGGLGGAARFGWVEQVDGLGQEALFGQGQAGGQGVEAG